jgi:hypothetical protein
MGPAKIRRGDSFPFVDGSATHGPRCVVLPTPTGVALEGRQVVQLLMHAVERRPDDPRARSVLAVGEEAANDDR